MIILVSYNDVRLLVSEITNKCHYIFSDSEGMELVKMVKNQI